MLTVDRPDDAAVRPDLAERWAVRAVRFGQRHRTLAIRVRRWRTLGLWLAIPAYLAGIVLVPATRRAFLVAIGLLYLLWQLCVLARSRTLTWSGYARTLTLGALLAPLIGVVEVGLSRAAGWQPADPAAAVAIAGPVEEVLKLLPLTHSSVWRSPTT